MRYDQMCRHQDQRTMTSDHGRLLQDSGFLKLGLRRSSLDNSVLTTTLDQIESCYQSERKDLIELYSGRHATATTQWTVDPSTSASLLIEAASIAYTRSNIKPELTQAVIMHQLRQAIERLFEHTEATRWYSPKTYCPPSRWELPVLPQAWRSWGRSSVGTLPNSYSHLGIRWSHGLTQTLREIMLDPQSRRPCDTSVSRSGTLELLKTRSATASGKYGST